MNRRNLLKILGACAGSPLLMPWQTQAQGAYQPERFRGQTLQVLWPSDYISLNAPVDYFPEFTKQTGIKVEVKRIPYGEIKNAVLAGKDKPQAEFDLFAYIAPWKTELFEKKCLADLGPLFKDPTIADPDFDFEDLIPGYVVNSCLVGGRKGYLEGANAKLVGIPRGMETSILAYKKDAFQKSNLTVPGSYTELVSAIKTIHRKTGLPAMTARLKPGHHCVHSWLLHFNPYGGAFFDDKWKASFNQTPGIEAVNFLKLVVETGSPELQTFGFAENQQEFTDGKSVMYLDSTGIIPLLNLPKYKAIKDNVGYALHPRGTRFSSAMAGFACGIAEKSKNQQAAFIFLQWLTNKKQDIEFTRHGVQSNRRSTLANEQLLAEIPYLEILRKQLLMANPDWRPMIAQWDDININYIGKAIPTALNNQQSTQTALNDCAEQINALMRKWGYQS
jgi:multiple sugar transport system substrate-binding protein